MPSATLSLRQSVVAAGRTGASRWPWLRLARRLAGPYNPIAGREYIAARMPVFCHGHSGHCHPACRQQ